MKTRYQWHWLLAFSGVLASTPAQSQNAVLSMTSQGALAINGTTIIDASGNWAGAQPLGVVGPPGPKGPQGPQGPQGPAGPARHTYAVCNDFTYAVCNSTAHMAVGATTGLCHITSEANECWGLASCTVCSY